MLSSNEEIFNAAIPPYQEALSKAGHKYTFTYQKINLEKEPSKRKNRKKNVLWYNPPFNKNVKTKIGEEFLKILDKCFPKSHPLAKVLNRHLVKVSFCCMANMSQIISRSNKRKIQEFRKLGQPEERTCDCRDEPCPVEGQCLISDVIYQATVKRLDNYETETYVGLSGCPFKPRY